MDIKDLLKGEAFSPAFDLDKHYANYHNILKNAVEGKVVTRFAPEPSGYMHIGHCKAALLSFHYAKIYKGNMILRFDDTNPSKEKEEFVDAIIEDLKTLGITYLRISYVSDYFDKMYGMMEGLVKKGLAYVDNTPVEQMREQRLKKIASECRAYPVEKNLEILQKMIKGEADEYCLRAKIDFANNNGCLRDPVLARSNRTPHHRTGKKYVLYPTYDFACPIVDSLDGVTHIMRSNEYADRIPQFKWIMEALELPPLEIFEYSRLNFEYALLSKRKLGWFVDTGRVDGWDDPRFPTVRGCLRKGIRVETLIEFMLEQGPSQRTNLMEWEKMWAINKRIIDPICPRYSAVSVEKASRITVVNGPKEPYATNVPMSKLNLNLGNRPTWHSSKLLIEYGDADSLVKVGEKITLMNWGNFMIHEKLQEADGSYNIKAEYLPEDKDFKTTKKITWLAEDSNLIIVNLVEYDHLIKTPKVEDDVEIEDIINPKSKFSIKAYVDSNLRTHSAGQYLQIERRAYYKIDKVSIEGGKLTYTLIMVPDGKKVGIASIASSIDKEGEVKKKDLAQKVEEKKNKEKKGHKKEDPNSDEPKQNKEQKNTKKDTAKPPEGVNSDVKAPTEETKKIDEAPTKEN